MSFLDQFREEIVAKYRQGASMAAIAEEYGCSPMTVHTRFKKWGEAAHKPKYQYEDKIPQALQLLAEGKSIAQVAIEVGIPRSTLQRIAKENGHDTSPHLKRCEFSLEENSSNIIISYQMGQSQSEIAKAYGCDESNISRLLKKHGIETRFHYECDHTFFDCIDTEEKAYTLGFFVADGYNHKCNVVSIRVIDEDVLNKMKDAIKYTGPISITSPPKKYPHWQVKYGLDIASKQMCDSLIRLGCPTKKTFITRFPTSDEVIEYLLVHYIRGVVDGDGSIYSTTNGWHISIAGTVALLDPMRHYIHKQTGVMFGIYPQGKIYVLKVGGNQQVGRVLTWLYNDATIYMDRKYKKYLEYVESCSLSTKEKANALSTSK